MQFSIFNSLLIIKNNKAKTYERERELLSSKSVVNSFTDIIEDSNDKAGHQFENVLFSNSSSSKKTLPF